MRFRLEDVVQLGGGLGRLPEPGEELYRLVVWGDPQRWMPEPALLELLSGVVAGDPALLPAEDLVIESTVWPGAPDDDPDPRLLRWPVVRLKCPCETCNLVRDHAGRCGWVFDDDEID